MKKYTQAVAGHETVILVPENMEDYNKFLDWLKSKDSEKVAVDTETTGLEIFASDFEVRLIQIGNANLAWVINVRRFDITAEALDLFFHDRKLIFQNAAYDILAIRQYFGYQIDWDSVVDTKILAHLVDSRSRKEGGTGHSLQELTEAYIDKDIAESIKGSMKAMAKEAGVKVGEVFKSIDTWNDTYLTYAGMDVILTYALEFYLERKVPEPSRKLIRYEHELARVCAEMEFNGFLLDVDYAQALSDRLKEEQDVWEALALVEYGVESVNSSADVAEALIEDGWKLNELTPSGEYKVSKEVLEPLAEQGCKLAEYVTEAKKAKKWRTSWVDKFLDQRDVDNRCHANINPLKARTARMSITGIPAQTLPSSDWTIRRCFIADKGQVMASCDYQAQELRVLAALSGDENMQRAFREDADLHQMTADASGVERKVGKTVNFAYVYGSGPKNIAETCGISVAKAKEVIKGFEKTYPGVKRLSDRLQKQAKRHGYIQTPTGRVLRVDKDRPYAALNYMIQSTSRDVTGRALLRLDEKGLTPYLRLPIHDEVVVSVPEERAQFAAEYVASLMAMDFQGVHIGTDADVYGPSWGSGYVKPDDDDYQDYLDTLKED